MDESTLGDGLLLQRLLKQASAGTAIITEIHKLRLRLPSILPSGRKSDDAQSAILFDFSYFQQADSIEQRIRANKTLFSLDSDWHRRNSDLLASFHTVCVAVYKFGCDLNSVVADITASVYLQLSLDTVFASVDGRQLMCELLYLYGVMLLMIDSIDGKNRERLLIAHYRLVTHSRRPHSSPESGSCHLDTVCQLLRSTGLSSHSRRPQAYPEQYFRRLVIDERLVKMAIGHLLTGDIFYQFSNYSLPEHRSVALASQATMLFVCLFFSCEYLHRDSVVMREIVDRFFPDSWTVHIYMGWCVSLFEWWDQFKSARAALHERLVIDRVRHLTDHHGNHIQKLVSQCDSWLRRQALTGNTLLQQMETLMALLRQCNVTLRWCITNGMTRTAGAETKRARQLREILSSDTRLAVDRLFQLLLNCSRLELLCRTQLKQILADRESIWAEQHTELVEGLREIGLVFAQGHALNKLAKNAGLERWFMARASDMESTSLQEAASDSRKLIQMVHALGEVLMLHRLENDMAVSHRLRQLCDILRHLAALAALRDNVLVLLDSVADFSYGCLLIDQFTEHIQSAISQQPAILCQFHAVFAKLSSAMDTPLIRMSQANSADLPTVSQHYSDVLVAYVQRLLRVVPQGIFRFLEQLAVIQQEASKASTGGRNDYVDLDEDSPRQQQLSCVVGDLCTLAEGILSMRSSLVGVVRIDSAQLLQQGLRDQLTQQLSHTLRHVLVEGVTSRGASVVTSSVNKSKGLRERLKTVEKKLVGLKSALELVQGYLRISALRMWNGELAVLVKSAVDEVVDWLRCHFEPTSCDNTLINCPANFMSCLTEMILSATDPRNCVYFDELLSWHTLRSGQSVCVMDRHLFTLISSVLSASALHGIDTILETMITIRLKLVVNMIQTKFLVESSVTDSLLSLRSCLDSGQVDSQTANVFKLSTLTSSRLQRSLAKLTDSLAGLGHLILLRDVITMPLLVRADLDSHHLAATLTNVNRSLLLEAQYEQAELIENSVSARTSSGDRYYLNLIEQFRQTLAGVGLSDAPRTVYLTSTDLRPVMSNDCVSPLLLLLMVHLLNSKLTFSPKQGGFLPLRDGLDVSSIVCGVSSLLHHLPTVYSEQLMVSMASYISSCFSSKLSVSSPPLNNAELNAWLVLMERLLLQSSLPDKLDNYVPMPIISAFRV